MPDFSSDLASLPSDWRLVRVGRNKKPIAGDGWFDVDDFSPDDALALNGSGPPAWGAKSGPASGGIVMLDLDSLGWDKSFREVTGHPVSDLPTTISWTSGKPQRSGHVFQVDEDWWEHLANRRYWSRPWREGDPLDKNGERKPVTLWELRWDRHQSVIIGAHPETGRYRWLKGCSPAELGDPAPAPDWLLEALVVQELPEAKPFKAGDADGERAVAMLQCIPASDYASYDAWLRIGMALHHTDAGLLSEWVEWCKGMGASFDEAECLRKWESFGKGHKGRAATIATLHYIAKQHGYTEPKRKRKLEPRAKGKAAVSVAAGVVSAKGGELIEVNAVFGGSDNDGASGGAEDNPKPWPFVLLGFNGDDFFYQPGESGQVMSISRAGHSSSSNLLSLARLKWWKSAYPRCNREGEVIGVNWQDAISDLIGRQYAVGCYDPMRIRGVGAWWDDGRVVYHLGDRLIINGKAWPVLKPPPSQYLYQRLPRRNGPGAAIPLSDAEGLEVLELAERFHWEAKASGTLLAGWVALAPICGVLNWRPHIWLNAVAQSGKSSVMKFFVKYLLGDLPLRVVGATTEAGIRQTLKSDALPVLFDEAESNEKPDIQRIQSVLTLARISSTDDQGVTVKGSPSAAATMFNIRSMFFMSSINTALKQGADRSRFSVLVLRIPDKLTAEQRQEHWEQLEADLVRTITPETGQRMIARMVALAGTVREVAKVMTKAAALELGTARQGDQIGTLLAGVWVLHRQDVPTLEGAQAFIRQSNVQQQAEGQADERGGDQGDCLQTILQSRLRVERGEGAAVTRTVAELIEAASREAQLGPGWPICPYNDDDIKRSDDTITRDMAEAELGRHGVGVDRVNGLLLVSNTAKGVARLLDGTPWSNGGWSNLLASLKGASRAGVTRFKGLSGVSRAVAIPKTLLLPDVSASEGGS